MQINISWEKTITNGIRDDVIRMRNFSPYLLGENAPYYASSYACPRCDFILYKMRTRGVTTNFNGRTVEIFNIFTCPKCRKFYASISTGGYYETAKPLREYALVSKTYSENEYKAKLFETLSFANGY